MSAPFTGRQQSTFRDGVPANQPQPTVPPLYMTVVGGVNTTISRSMPSTVAVITTAAPTVLLLDSSFKKGDVVTVICTVNDAGIQVNANTGGAGTIIGAAFATGATPAAGLTARFLCVEDSPNTVAKWIRF